MEVLVLFLLVSIISAVAAVAEEDTYVGVNIGTKVTSMPHPTAVVALLKSQQIRHVRLYDADAAMLRALANTTVAVAITVPNDQIPGISQSNTTAAKWVSQNVLTHHPSTNITTICVGANALTSAPPTAAALLLPNALKNLHSALVAANLDKQIKISTPISSAVIVNSFPPSQAYFNKSLNPILLPLLKFMQSTNSHFMIAIYPYLEHVRSNDIVSLDYALFEPLSMKKQAVDASTSLRYSNAFDAMVDAAYSAMANLNITNVPVVVAETGWPSSGGADEPDATSDNARTYITNLMKHVQNRTGTPMHPGIAVTTYIYELYDEDEKLGHLSERNWGLFKADGESKYAVKFSGSDLEAAANGSASETHCAAKAGADEKMVQAALDWACGSGGVDCSALMAGRPCFEPDTLAAHATYAFDAYYQRMGRAAGSCDFNGVATITTASLNHGSCMISAAGSAKNGSSLNSTAPAMDSESSSYSDSSLGCGCGDAFSAAKLVIGFIGCVAVMF